MEVTGTDFVTLSGGSGSLTVTLVNGLQHPDKVTADLLRVIETATRVKRAGTRDRARA